MLVAVDVLVAVGVLVAVDVLVAVGVLVAVDVLVAVGVLVAVDVLVTVGVLVAGTEARTFTLRANSDVLPAPSVVWAVTIAPAATPVIGMTKLPLPLAVA